MKDDRELSADVTIKRKKGGFFNSETPNLPYAEWLQNLRIVGTNGMGITPKNTSALFLFIAVYFRCLPPGGGMPNAMRQGGSKRKRHSSLGVVYAVSFRHSLCS